MLKNKFIMNFMLYILISIIIYSISFYYIKYEEEKQLNIKYTNISNQLKQSVNTLILEKKNSTLALAMSLTKDKRIENALLNNDNSELDFRNFSKYLKDYTKFKNVWFHIIDKDGKSFYRSWIKKTKDDVTFRPDVRKALKEEKILATISVGKFDMTFKSMIPIFSDKKLIGLFEVITHFNSLSKTLNKDKVDSLILADKKYKSKIIKPFTNKFLDDYYVANNDAKESLIKQVQNIGLEKIININNYEIINNRLFSVYSIKNVDKKHIGYYILSQKISDIDKSDIMKFKKNTKRYILFFILIIGILYTIISYYIYAKSIKLLNKKLKTNIKKIKEHEKINQTILDSQKNLIVITDGEFIKNSNKQLLEFYGFKNLKKFMQKYKCICETFIDMKDDNYLIDKNYNGKNWAEFILANPDKTFKAAIKKDKEIHHFTLDVSSSFFDNLKIPYIIVTLTDITQEIKIQKELRKLNGNLEELVDIKTKELQKLNESLEKRVKEEIDKSHEKDRVIFQQNKMASMGEMLSNIAHQWRQPLSSISAAVGSLKIQKELNLVNDEDFDNLCEHILKNSRYLSQTIEDFKNFFKQDEDKTEFILEKSINENISLLKNRLLDNKIKTIVNIPTHIKLFGYKKEFQQAILNILNNSLDAFIKNKQTKIKIISIYIQENTLYIQDSAKGIDENIIEKIFDPYFTTKHQSQGTGLGLYMAREILSKSMNMSLFVQNNYFDYNDEKLYGACFKIELNKE